MVRTSKGFRWTFKRTSSWSDGRILGTGHAIQQFVQARTSNIVSWSLGQNIEGLQVVIQTTHGRITGTWTFSKIVRQINQDLDTQKNSLATGLLPSFFVSRLVELLQSMEPIEMLEIASCILKNSLKCVHLNYMTLHNMLLDSPLGNVYIFILSKQIKENFEAVLQIETIKVMENKYVEIII